MNVADFLDRLDNVKRCGKGWTARCPAHDDHHNSLSVSQGDDRRILANCFAGCTTENVVQALGLTMADLFQRRNGGRKFGIRNESSSEGNNCKKIWKATLASDHRLAKPLRSYLEQRGLKSTHLPRTIRFAQNLEYFSGKIKDHFPAIVAKVAALNGKGVAILRIYLTHDGRKADIETRKKALGPIGGNAVHLDEPGKTLALTEGLETGLCVREATGLPTWCAISAQGLVIVQVPAGVAEVHIWADLDRSQVGQSSAFKLSRRLASEGRTVFLHIPDGPIPEGSKSVDWLDVLNADGTEALRIRLAQAKPLEIGANDSDDQWAHRSDLPRLLPEAPGLPAEMLPMGLRNWLVDVAERLQVPLEFVAAPALVALTSLVGRQLGIHPKRHDDWLVVPNLCGAVVARPGMLKSPSIAAVLKPIEHLAKIAHKEQDKEKAGESAAIQIHKARIQAVKEEAKKVARKKVADLVRLQELEEQLIELEAKTPSIKQTERRYKTNDATIEKIAEILKENPRGLLVYRDELSGWMRALDKTGREGDREFFLESWNGIGSFTVDRIGRGTLHLEALCLSILGGIQPGRLERYVSDAVQGGMGDDGLLQRFQLIVYPETPSQWQNVDRRPDRDAQTRAYEVFNRLDRLEPAELGATIGEHENIPALRFSEEAQELFDEWLTELQKRLLSGDEDSPAFQSHLSKYRSLMPSLALLFDLVDWADERKEGGPVSLGAARKAAALCDFLEQHARKVYAGAIHPQIQAAHALARKIRAGKIKHGDQVRSLYRNQWSLLQTRSSVYDGLTVLEDCHWVRVETQPTGGRSSDVVRLHPELRGGGK